MPKKGEYVKFRDYESNINTPFIIYADVESILVPQENGKQNPEEAYKNQISKACCLQLWL